MSLDIEMMLYKDMLWLVEQVDTNIKHFADVSSKLQLDNNNLDLFWKNVAKKRNHFTFSD